MSKLISLNLETPVAGSMDNHIPYSGASNAQLTYGSLESIDLNIKSTNTIDDIMKLDIVKDTKKLIKKNKCPKCGKGDFFIKSNPYINILFYKGDFHENCPSCNLKYDLDIGVILDIFLFLLDDV